MTILMSRIWTAGSSAAKPDSSIDSADPKLGHELAIWAFKHDPKVYFENSFWEIAILLTLPTVHEGGSAH